MMGMKLFIALFIVVFMIAGASSVAPKWTKGTCLAWGDPHFTTFDGNQFSFQDDGWYVMMSSPSAEVWAHFYHCTQMDDDITTAAYKESTVHCIDEVKVFSKEATGTKVVYASINEKSNGNYVGDSGDHKFYSFLQFQGNNQPVVPTWVKSSKKFKLPAVGTNTWRVLSDTLKVKYKTSSNILQYTISVSGATVVFSSRTIVINPTNLYKKTCGICGTYNKKQDDDFYKSNWATIHVSAGNAREFVKSWAAGGDPDFRCKKDPTPKPTPKPTKRPPTSNPTPKPTTKAPTKTPTIPPTKTPTNPPPTMPPTSIPSNKPTPTPTSPPTATTPPTEVPTTTPAPTETLAPTETPEPTVPEVSSSDDSSSSSHPSGSTDSSGEIDVIFAADDDNTTVPEYPQMDLTIHANDTLWAEIISQYNGTDIWNQAIDACIAVDASNATADFHNCMFDVIQTNDAAAAVDTLKVNYLSCTTADDSDTGAAACSNGTLLDCPNACNAHGKCVAGNCQCDKGYDGIDCEAVPLLTVAETAGVIAAGVVVAIAIGAVVFVVLGGYGAKKGYDYLKNTNNKMSNTNSNPLYQENKAGGQNPFYETKA